MQVQTIATVLASITVLLGAAWTYWLTKKKEREAEIRREKLEYYKAFIASLSGILQGESSAEGQKIFAKACNNLFLFAPQPVLETLRDFRMALVQAIAISAKKSTTSYTPHCHFRFAET
jgi:hypothetical protein